MYLTIKEHDAFRTLLMGFEIPYRAYIADTITKAFSTDSAFELAMIAKNEALSSSSPKFLKDVLPRECANNKLKGTYTKFTEAASSTSEIVTADKDMPMVGALNIVTFAFPELFRGLLSIFDSYDGFCSLAEKYRYARNKLDHPGCKTLSESDSVPVLSFVQDICVYLDDKYFLQKSKLAIEAEISALQKRKQYIPIKIENFSEMPFSNTRIVCRDSEIENIKKFVYGNPEDLRKRHSYCIYGYGGVGKTALVLEAIKQIVQDISDAKAECSYAPEYLLFFSAKKRRLNISSENGKVFEQGIKWHFETANELITLIKEALKLDSFKDFHKDGLIIVDNLETLTDMERETVKQFIETQTPSEIQFIITSRHSEEYETNVKLYGFEQDSGKQFISIYSEENSLELELSDPDTTELLNIAKGNTLVLVLCLRRLSRQLSSISGLKSEFSYTNSWKSIRAGLSKVPPNAYEVLSEFMFKDTFEHIETTFSSDIDLFHQILKVFAIIENEKIDLSTVCLLTDKPYQRVESVADTLCNYLILEKSNEQYSLNEFAEKYVVGRFIPDAESYEKISIEIINRQRRVQESLRKLNSDIKMNPGLERIMKDWQIMTDIDRITAAKMYGIYGSVQRECRNSGKFKVTAALEDMSKECDESESMTSHPYIKFQKARILQMIDDSNILDEKHSDSIIKSYRDAIYVIKTIDQYSSIQRTKSYASLLWLFGQYLCTIPNHQIDAIRYLEEGKRSFEEQKITTEQYYQCITRLATVYVDYYIEDRTGKITYLRQARTIDRILQSNKYNLGKAYQYAQQLHGRLSQYGKC